MYKSVSNLKSEFKKVVVKWLFTLTWFVEFTKLSSVFKGLLLYELKLKNIKSVPIVLFKLLIVLRISKLSILKVSKSLTTNVKSLEFKLVCTLVELVKVVRK